MNMDENAEVFYNPEDEPTGQNEVQQALAEAERQLMHRDGIHGVGVAMTPDGQDAILVYVQNAQVLSQLPSHVSGIPVIGEIAGDIRAF